MGELPSDINCTPQDAWKTLSEEPESALIDVRTPPEWAFVGVPNLDGLDKKMIALSWKIFPSMEVNTQFVDQLKSQLPDPSTPLYFLCKVGGRSLDAALLMRQHGYTNSYNIEHGFEGDLNEEEHRGRSNGWKAEGLPWRQN